MRLVDGRRNGNDEDAAEAQNFATGGEFNEARRLQLVSFNFKCAVATLSNCPSGKKLNLLNLL
jgi:hypothetical protein